MARHSPPFYHTGTNINTVYAYTVGYYYSQIILFYARIKIKLFLLLYGTAISPAKNLTFRFGFL